MFSSLFLSQKNIVLCYLFVEDRFENSLHLSLDEQRLRMFVRNSNVRTKRALALGKKYLENRCTGIRRINPFAHLVANYFLSTSNCRYVCIYVFSFSFKGSKRFLFLSLLVRETLSMEILRL